MIDTRTLAEQPELVKETLRRRHADDDSFAAVDRVESLFSNRREKVTERDTLRAERNTLSKAIGGLYKQGKRDEAEAMKAKVHEGGERIKVLETEIDAIEGDMRHLAMMLPNLLHSAVPDGKGEEDNVEIRSWGTKRSFDFDTLAHVEVGENLGILDFEASAKLAGARFGVLRGLGARLERALIQFCLDVHTQENGYTEVAVPYLVHRDVAAGTGQLPKFEHDMFKLAEPLNGQDAFLIPTAEVPVTNLHRGEIVELDQPIKYCAFTPCFRSEAGSAGRDVRGLIRQHQFHKVEMVWFTTPERAEQDHASLVRHAEDLLERLELPYRTMELCTGDISFGAHRCFDIEVWLPSQGYREISSCSHFAEFQGRRMNTRFRPAPAPGQKKAKPQFVHTLNGSGLPSGRTMVALLENNQQKDGSVVIPKVLRPYMGGLEIIEPQR